MIDENEEFMKIEIEEDLKSDSIKITSDVQKCVLNWKPDSLLVLRQFFKKFTRQSGNTFMEGELDS